ncbi:glycosyltransferase family 2 protein [Fontisphaera persica]|uniref:glycosyltransferase family 2 protein n=1 Tax=Fontisphaera persica TaxID=2974023 RepID=UPI0024C00E1C|nr:glycosyltransferase family 2 protein [Fontisphaera persica]WCJ60008.1 glycosyltransferase family 2 protein [Fontisphaera persica]
MRRGRAKFIEPAVTVLLPVYNAAATLRAAIRSICTQTLSDWELLVVDDGSTDDSAPIAQHLALNDRRIQVLRRPHEGLVSALEAGLRQARGRYIARMDADDVCYPDRLEKQVELLDWDSELGLVGGLVEYGGEAAANQGFALHVDWMNSLTKAEDIYLNRFIESPFAHPSVMFRRNLIDRYDGYRAGPFPEDYELWLRWMDAGVGVAKVKHRVIIWNDSPQRLSRQDPRYSQEAFYEMKAYYLARTVKRLLQGRSLWIWGAGRVTRKRAAYLENHGLTITGYVDVDPAKCQPGRASHITVLPEQLPPPDKAFVAGYVANRGARQLIRQALRQRGFVEGKDFLMAA